MRVEPLDLIFGVAFVGIAVLLIWVAAFYIVDEPRREQVCRDMFGTDYVLQDPYRGITVCTSSKGDIKAYPREQL
ncbi:hypothetical protein DFR67_114152 [Williamsia limnetica]|uniref:Uncharacterized protein n=1 Tax=Williamsia limnetica TaxID=882452 RepID=A0A318RQG0_WILLI|nr:hypothetical protein [Williamsia limnetica]PYE14053.1 hypothetical protein DFR67_114152 [Williamsia limnetica]